MTANASYWEETANRWQSDRSHRLWRKHSDAVNLELFERWLSHERAERVLKTDLFDEASSDGLVPLLEDRAGVVAGIDVSFLTVRAAQSRFPAVQPAVADVRRLPFVDGAFDCIVSNSTLDHFDSSDQITVSLVELRRVLKPGGQLLLTLDNRANPVVWLRNALPFSWLSRLGIVPYYVGVTCGPRRLRNYVQQAGLETLETTAVMHCPRIFAVALSRYLNRWAGARAQRRFLRFLMAFERLERWPTRFLTGYFVAILAVKPAT